MKITVDITDTKKILEIKQFLEGKGVVYEEVVGDDEIFQVIEEDTNNFIHPTAIIYPNVKIGNNVYIGAYSVIGGPPEHREFWDGEYKGVIIEDNVRISNHVTIDAGCTQNTYISKGCILLKGSHVGHDAFIGDNTTLSCNALVGGYSQISYGCNLGLGSVIHQNVVVPPGCMIGANAFVGKTTKTEPNNKYVGVPARYLGPNIKK